MEMSQVRQDILEAVNLKLGARDLTCPLCAGVGWLPPSIVTHAEVVLAEGSIFEPTLTGQVLPLAILTCDQCGYSVSLNLVRLGLWQKWQNLSHIIVPGSRNGNLKG